MHRIDHADVLTWPGDGKFHAVLCDPPYELGFMGKRWDGTGVAFQPETWARIGEHLYPGAFLFAFAGSRTYHRICCAIEDAGYIIHPMLGWVYGCLSEDTEILTADGWKTYNQDLTCSRVMCYNVNDGSFQFMPVKRVYVYSYSDTAYRIQSDSTDQLVSRNHRCLVERGGSLVFRQAETLQRQEIVPILESMPNVQQAFCCNGQPRVLQENPLFADMCKQDNQSQAKGPASIRQAQWTGDCLSGMRTGSLQTAGVACGCQRTNLLAPMQREVTIQNVGLSCEQGPYGVDGAITSFLQKEDDRPEQPGLEGWRNLLPQAWELRAYQVCTVSRGVPYNGTEGWVRDGASLASGPGNRAVSEAFRGSASYQSRSYRQSPRKPGSLCEQHSPQEIRGGWRTRTTLATITPVYYNGIVWCVSVPTGAFVARRNGHVFITGNSGFPKATRIDTQVDKAAGAEQEVVGRNPNDRDRRVNAMSDYGLQGGVGNGMITTPATPLATAWAGHRYGLQALKPALEPIIVAQKPYAGKPVDSITETGAGALWVDGGRIGTEPITSNRWDDNAHPFGGGAGNDYTPHISSGRWPANFALLHHLECNGDCHPDCPVRRLDEAVGERPVGRASPENHEPTKADGRIYGFANYPAMHKRGVHYGDAGGPSRFFFNADYALERLEALELPFLYTPKASRSERDAGCEGMTAIHRGNGNKWTDIDYRVKRGERGPQRESGPRHNPHPTIKPIALARWLATLLLPPAEYAPRRLLVPFAGVGSEMIGALLAGWEDVVGVELEAEYIPLAEARLDHWAKQPVQLAVELEPR